MQIINLIKKEFLLNKDKVFIIYGMFFLFMIVFSQTYTSANALIFIGSVYGALCPLIVIVRENKFNAEAVTCSLPVSRQKIIVSKYLFSWIVMPIMTYSILSFCAIIPSILSFGSILSLKSLFLILGTITFSIIFMLPFLINYGFKGLIFFIVFMNLFGVLLFLSAKLLRNKGIKELVHFVSNNIVLLRKQIGDSLFYILLLVSLFLLNYLSYKISLFFYQRKEW